MGPIDNAGHEEMIASVNQWSTSQIPLFQREEFYNSVPRPLFKSAGDLGLTGLAVSETYGGLAAPPTLVATILEEIAAVDLGPSIFISVHNMVAGIIERSGNASQKAEFLPKMAEGELLGAFALSEPSAGSDASSLETSFTVRGDGFSLTGQKIYITSAGFADLYVTFARQRGAGDKTDAISAFLIPPEIVHAKNSGLTIGSPERKMGCELSPIATLYFDDLRLPKSCLLGEMGRGYAAALGGLAGGRISIAACALGVARNAIARALEHLKERKQFGKALIEFQGLQFMLADMQMKWEAARALTHEAARILEHDSKDRRNRLFPSYAKCFATDTAMQVTTDAVQLLGGAGYLKEYGVEKLMRDAKMLQIVEGTNQIQRMIIARELARD